MNAVIRTTPNGHQAAAAYLASLKTDVSRRGQMTALRMVAQALGQTTTDTHGRTIGNPAAVDWSTLNAANVRAIMAHIHGAPATRNKVLSAMKGVARMAAELGQINHETRAAIEGIHGDKGSRLPAGRDIDAGEVAALMKACANDQSAAGARDASMIALMASTGMRRAEVAALKLSDLHDGGEIHVTGKGNKQRKVFIVNGTARAMADWLSIRGTAGEHVYCTIGKTGTINTRHGLTPQSINKMLTKRGSQAGIEDFTAHDFRRTLAGTLLDNGNDIATVARLLGHSSVSTTQRYDRRGDEAVKRAAQGVSVPYYGRHPIN